MNDSRTLRIQELKRLSDDATKRVEELKSWRVVIANAAKGSIEGLWLLQVVDNRRALLMDRIIEYGKGIELARENARPEIGALFIDGEKVEIDSNEEEF